ncbi:hypothetical protein ACJZRZ_004752 [Vibrio parahaemolyticus]|nr:hypothetical protein [Vibrio parahaemolyticus]
MRAVLLLGLIGVMGSAWANETEATPSSADTGVTFIDALSQNEVLRQYLLPPPLLVDKDQSDEALYEFMNKKTKWEEND